VLDSPMFNVQCSTTMVYDLRYPCLEYRCPNGTDRPFGPKPDTILTWYQPDPTRSPPCPGRAGPTAGPCMGHSLGTACLARPGPFKQASRRWPVTKKTLRPPYLSYPLPSPHPPQSLCTPQRRSPNPNPLRFCFARRRWTSAVSVAVLHSSPRSHRPAHRW
jgi:hypothetical protein